MHLRIFSCALVLTTACSSGFASGVDGSKPVSTLTASEAAIACEGFSDYLISSFPQGDQDRFNCYAVGLQELTPEACQAAFNACMVSPPSGPVSITPSDCTGATADTTCNATVSQYEACVTALVGNSTSRFDEIDCSIAGNLPEIMRLSEALPSPAECTSIEAICPNVPGL